jgi:hypothetical protein
MIFPDKDFSSGLYFQVIQLKKDISTCQIVNGI